MSKAAQRLVLSAPGMTEAIFRLAGSRGDKCLAQTTASDAAFGDHVSAPLAVPDVVPFSRRSPAAPVAGLPYPLDKRRPDKCSASPLAYLDDSSERTKGFVDRFAVGEQLRYVGIQHHHVRSLGIALRVLTTDTTTKIIVSAHLITFAGGFLHTPSARPRLAGAR